MKYTVLFLLLFLCALSTTAQSVWSKPLPPDPSTWLINYLGQPAPNGCGDYSGYCGSIRYRMAGDTLFGVIPYKKLCSSNGLKYHPNYSTGYFTGDSLFPNYEGALRQDTVANTVYIRRPGKSNDTLLYSFNLQVGDTLPISYINDNTYFKPVVRKIDTILVGAIHYRRFQIGQAGNMSYDPSLIEGIGSTEGYLNHLYLFFEGGPELICFNKNSVPPQNGGYECTDSFVTGIQENPPSAFHISSNPSDGLFVLSSFSTAAETCPCAVYDCNGHIVFNKLLTGPDYMIDIRNRAAGIYFLRVQANTGNWTAKLLVR